jgi:hypothetical protein
MENETIYPTLVVSDLLYKQIKGNAPQTAGDEITVFRDTFASSMCASDHILSFDRVAPLIPKPINNATIVARHYTRLVR